MVEVRLSCPLGWRSHAPGVDGQSIRCRQCKRGQHVHGCCQSGQSPDWSHAVRQRRPEKHLDPLDSCEAANTAHAQGLMLLQFGAGLRSCCCAWIWMFHLYCCQETRSLRHDPTIPLSINRQYSQIETAQKLATRRTISTVSVKRSVAGF